MAPLFSLLLCIIVSAGGATWRFQTCSFFKKKNSSCSSVRDLQFLNIKVEPKWLPLTLAFTFMGTILLKEERLPGAKGLAQGLGRGWGDKRWLSHTCREVPGPRLFPLKVTLRDEFCLKGEFHTWTEFRFECVRKLQSLHSSAAAGRKSHVHSEWASGRLHTSASEGKAEVAPRSAFHVSINPKIERTQRQLQQLFKH